MWREPLDIIELVGLAAALIAGLLLLTAGSIAGALASVAALVALFVVRRARRGIGGGTQSR